MNENTATWIGIAISILGLIFVYVQGVIKVNERLTRVETKVDVFWKDVGYLAAHVLHTPHPENARRDFLIERFLSKVITRDELIELINLLQHILNTEEKRFGEHRAAEILLRTLDKQYQI